ncbi:MAG: hypothetical protein ACJZ4O_01200 [Pelagibacteraceae bacterium]
MNKIKLYIIIIVFLSITGNVFSKISTFDVDNIIIDNSNSQNNQEILNKAFKKGFLKLINRILLNKDVNKIKKSNLNDIKELISSYQIIQNSNSLNKNDTLINISFDRNKMNNFFYKNNISYADISKSKIIVFPVILQNESINIFDDNYFYKNWNSNEINETNNFIEYLLPLENIDDIQFLNKFKDNLESIDVKKMVSSYNVNDYIFLVIKPLSNSTNVFVNGEISNNKIIKNIKILGTNDQDQIQNYKNIINKLKLEINDIWKSQNLIDIGTPSFLNINLDIDKLNDLLNLQTALDKIDLVMDYRVLELNKNYAKIRIKYIGKINKIKSKFDEQGIMINIVNNVWNLKVI